jgi:hypothetical protein
MKVQLLNPGEPTKQYAVIFYQGDEAFSGLLEFAQTLIDPASKPSKRSSSARGGT